MPTGTPGGLRGMPATGIDTSEGGRPISVAMALTYCTRVSRTAMAWASMVCTWVCAVITSERAATPAAYWFSVIARVLLKFSTFSSSTFWRESA